VSILEIEGSVARTGGEHERLSLWISKVLIVEVVPMWLELTKGIEIL
jgi:hypothetical protein